MASRENFGNPWLTNIHEVERPEAISLFPNAPGFWLLAFCLLLAFIVYTLFFLRSWRVNAYRREALRCLKQLARRCDTGALTVQDKRQIPELVRRVASASWGRSRVAPLNGSEWLDFLKWSSADGEQPEEGDLLLTLSYLPETEINKIETLRIKLLISSLCRWVKSHRGSDA
jgi:hypothetical protein